MEQDGIVDSSFSMSKKAISLLENLKSIEGQGDQYRPWILVGKERIEAWIKKAKQTKLWAMIRKAKVPKMVNPISKLDGTSQKLLDLKMDL